MDRIVLGNEEFEGRNNAYVLADDDADELALVVDTGIATDDIRRDLREGLAERGYEFADVDDIVLTHFHVDHAGLDWLAKFRPKATRPSTSTRPTPRWSHRIPPPSPPSRSGVGNSSRVGRPRRCTSRTPRLFESAEIEGSPADPTPIEDGERLAVGGRTLETVHAPGHAAGLCCFETESGDEAFVGDALLPVYTPNVGGADVRVERPLERYVATLDRLIDRDYERVWPGHRDPIAEPTARADAILEHHRERTDTIPRVSGRHGPADAWTVSAPPVRRPRGNSHRPRTGRPSPISITSATTASSSFEHGEYRLREEPTGLEDEVR